MAWSETEATSEFVDFGVCASPQDSGLVLHLRGEIDIATLPTLADALSEAVAGQTEVVTIDLSMLDFLDVCGVRELLSVRDTLRAQGRQLDLQMPSPRVEMVLAIVGLADGVQPIETAVVADPASSRLI